VLNKKIFLIGMPASGKTNYGKKLAKFFNVPFLDLDREIEKTTQQSISALFKDKGEAHFRILETKQLQLIIANHQVEVIACGGGTPCFYNNLELMKNAGLVIYLDISLEKLIMRLNKKQTSNRPLLSNEENLKAKLQAILTERSSYYLQAHHSIRADLPFEQFKLMVINYLSTINK